MIREVINDLITMMMLSGNKIERINLNSLTNVKHEIKIMMKDADKS